MTIKIDQFHGIMPRIHPTLLQDGMAVTAHNCRLKNGKVAPIRQPSVVSGIGLLKENGLADISLARSMHAWKRADGSIDFLVFPGMTWMADGNIADDDKTRVILSGETGVSFTDNSVSPSKSYSNAPCIYYRENGNPGHFCICKNRLRKPVASRTEGVLGESANARYTCFFWTWVDRFGYESPISEASDEVVYEDGDSVNIGGFTAQELASMIDVEEVRIYKVVTGTSEGRIQFVYSRLKSQLLPDTAMSFIVKDEDAGEVINEIEGMPGDIWGVTDVPGGFYVGVSASSPKTVMFSAVDLIYSWPIAHQYDVRDNIVALAVTSNTVFALTDGWPYVLSGTSPDGMTVTKLAGPAACVSNRGVCVFKNAVYYVSNEGLMSIYNSADAGTVCQNITDKVFTKDQWLSYNPSSCIMCQYDGALHLFFTKPDGSHSGLVIDLNEGQNAVTTHDEVAKCACVDNKTDKMYFVREGE